MLLSNLYELIFIFMQACLVALRIVVDFKMSSGDSVRPFCLSERYFLIIVIRRLSF